MLKIIGVLGFIVCLLIMYLTDYGIPGIRKYDAEFETLDMQFHYNIQTVQNTFEKIGFDGRLAYNHFLILDYFFIICFLVVMIVLSKSVSNFNIVLNTLYILCILRAVFDCLENTMIIFMMNKYPLFSENIANICSYMTTLKFIMLYSWITIFIIQLILNIINRFSKG